MIYVQLLQRKVCSSNELNFDNGIWSAPLSPRSVCDKWFRALISIKRKPQKDNNWNLPMRVCQLFRISIEMCSMHGSLSVAYVVLALWALTQRHNRRKVYVFCGLNLWLTKYYYTCACSRNYKLLRQLWQARNYHV